MTPCAMEAHPHPTDSNSQVGATLLELVSVEIEQLRNSKDGAERCFHSFPPSCLAMLKGLEGNHRCVDCGEQNPQWAACRYGALLCLKCSGHHRSLGVQVSSVRSISMDEWSATEVISMLEGGNSQIALFFDRHALTEKNCGVNSNSKESLLPNTAVATASNNISTTTTPTTSITKENVTRLRYKTKAALFYRRQMEIHVATILAAGTYQGREISRRLNPETEETESTNVA